VGLRIGRSASGVFYVTDVVRFQGTPLAVEKAIQNIASQDGRGVTVWIEQDPGQAGKAEAAFHVRNLAGLNVRVNPVREAKGVRARPLSAQAEAGNVKVVRAPWNDTFFDELENFDGTDRCVSDQVDAASGAFFALATAKRVGTWASA
jgi:predicted phage terminase large subunit-like protein